MRLATNLKRLRARRGWYLTELQAATGIDNADLSRYERGRAEPKLRNAYKLAEVFGVTLDELTGRAPLPPATPERVPSLRRMAEARERGDVYAGGTR